MSGQWLKGIEVPLMHGTELPQLTLVCPQTAAAAVAMFLLSELAAVHLHM